MTILGSLASLLSQLSDPATFGRTLVSRMYTAPSDYGAWWLQLIQDDPIHVFVETLLIISLIWIVFFKRKTTKKTNLTPAEMDSMVEEWQPEPLVPEVPATTAARPLADVVITKQGRTHVEVEVAGGAAPARSVLNLASFDFLGMAGSEEVKEAARETLREYGCGSCGPRGFYGTTEKHAQLEVALADFLGTEESISYSDAASTIASAIPAFAKRTDLLVVDEGVNAAAITGCILSRAKVLYFKHNDMEDLRRVITSVTSQDKKKGSGPDKHRRFIVVEGVYRDRGDLCPLAEVVAIKKEFRFRLFLDDAFGLGVLGATGRGSLEHHGLKIVKDVEVMTSHLSSSLGSVGGFCVGDREVVDHQRLSGAGYCFSASAPPFVAQCATTALQMLRASPDLAATVRARAALLHRLLSTDAEALLPGMAVTSQPSAPVLFIRFSGDAWPSPLTRAAAAEQQQLLHAIAAQALENGVLLAVTAPWFGPTNPKAPQAGTVAARKAQAANAHTPLGGALRLSVNAAHSEDDCAAAADAVRAAVAAVMAGSGATLPSTAEAAGGEQKQR